MVKTKLSGSPLLLGAQDYESEEIQAESTHISAKVTLPVGRIKLDISPPIACDDTFIGI